MPQFLIVSGRIFLIFCLLCLAPAALQAQVGTALDDAEAWLLSQQNLDGSLGAVPELVPRDSAVTVLALAGRPSAQEAVDRSAAFLANVPEENTQFRSRRALGLAEAQQDPSSLLATLGTFKNGGGMGAFGEHQSNLIDTAFAIQAFSLDEGTYLFDIADLLDYLQDHRNVDGGWGFVPGSNSEVYFSGETLATLAGLQQLAIGQQVIDDASTFLQTRQQGDGGLGGVLDTAVGWRGLLDAGQSDADLPFGSPLQYLLDRQLPNGSWEDDVFTTAQVVRVLRLQAPNLIISNLEALPPSVTPGTAVQIQATVKNLGPEAAPESHLALRLDALDGPLLDEAAVAALAVGEEVTVTVTLDTATWTASADVFAVADGRSELAETQESDNSDQVRVTLRTGPDLALFPSDLAVVPEQPAPGASFPLQITARNLGESDVNSFEYRVSRDVGGSLVDVAGGTAGPIPAGSATVIEVSLDLPEGEHTVEVTLDPNGLLDEELETNNDSTLSFFVVDPSQADLAIANVVLTPAEPNPGDTVTVDVTVDNLGGRDATADLALYENNPDEGGSEMDRTSVSVPAGGQSTHSATVTFSGSAHSVTAWVDPQGAVLELNEVNNRRQVFFRQLPDLALGFDNLEISPSEPLDGDPVTVSVTLRNGGTADANGVALVVYDGEPGAGGTVLHSETVSIPAAGNRRVSFPWTASGGFNQLVAVADPDDLVLELSESNNQTALAVPVPRGSGPDLVIATVDRSALTESVAEATLQGNLDLTLGNIGDADVSTPFAVRLFEDVDGSGHHTAGEPVLAQTVVGDALAVGGSASVTLAVDASMSFHHALLWLEVDAGDVVAEQREDNNLKSLFADCETTAPSGSLEPDELWYLPGVNVETAPLVLQLSDDNGDGFIDSRDTPDIVFHTTDADGIAIKAVSGLDGSDVWTFRSSMANPLVNHLAQLAAADLDGDGRVEIVGHQRNGRFVVLEHTGALAWVSDRVPGVGNRSLGGPAIGDLDGDGVPEIVQGRAVVSNTGELIAVGTGNNGENVNYYGPFGVVKVPGVGSYPQSAIADIDLDGRNEVIAGDTVYRLENGVLEIVWNATAPDNLMRDGFSAVANLDGDPEAEIVYVSSDQIMTFNHTGSVKAPRRLMEPFSLFELPTYWGGAPTVADLDGDGTPEILVSTATHVRAYSAGLGLRWKKSIGPDFGGVTGVTAFDLDGDGIMEVLFNDERNFYILNGLNGQVLHSRYNHSFTAMEYPVVADVTGDGRVDIVLPSSRARNRDTSTMGIHVLSHPSWRGTRPMWNQYGYSVTNVALDGTVPSPMTPAWQTDNLFRGNRNLTAPPSYLPNLTVSKPRVGSAGPDGVPVTLRVGNGGRQPIPAGVVVTLYDGDPATTSPVGSAVTAVGLRPGAWTDLEVLWQAAGDATTTAIAVVDFANDVVECDEFDNQVSFLLTETLLPDLAIAASGVQAASPVAAGQLLPVEVTVENVGPAASATFSLRLFDGDPALGVVLADLQAEPLGAGEVRVETLFWDTTGASGIHLIHAVVDSEGAVPEGSEANNSGLTEVVVHTATAPDLAAEALSAQPALVEAGEVTTLQAVVANRGAVLEGGFTLAFRVNNAEAGRVLMPETLAPGAQVTVDFELGTVQLQGVAYLEVRLDPDDAVAELDETNNRTQAELEVTPASLSVAVSTDRTAYGANEDVAVTVTVQNLDDVSRAVDVSARIVDAFGAEVASLAQQPLNAGPGATQLDLPWNTGTTLPGSYSVLVDVTEGGVPKARGNALFNISGEETTRASLFADQDVYTPLETVQLFGMVYNDSANTLLTDLVLRLAVTDSSGVEVFSESRDLLALYPGSSAPMNGQWEISNAPAGTYTASLSLRDSGGDLLAFDSFPFQVEDSAQTGAGLSGDLMASPDLVGAGEPLSITWQVSNNGNNDLDALQLRIELVRLSDGFVADQRTLPQPLAQGASAEGSLGFDTRGLGEADYLATLVGVLPGDDVRLDRAAFASGYAVSIGDAELDEGDGGSSVMTFQLALSTVFSAPVTVDYATFDGSAVAGEDYVSTSGTVTFAPGEFVQTVDVTVLGDVNAEGDEVFLVRLSNASGVLLGDAQGLGLLRDEEGCGSRNLLTDGDAETVGGLSGWLADDDGTGTASDGGDWSQRFGDPTPLSGLASFSYGGDGASSTLSQTVDLGSFTARIDAGLQEFLAEAFLLGRDGSISDSARLLVEYRDASGTVLEVFDSGELTVGGGLDDDRWTAVVDRRLAPVGSRSARVILEVAEYGGDGVSVFFDRVGFRSLGVPTLQVSDAEILEGDSGSTLLTFPVELSCAAGAIDVDFETSNDSATAGSDYESASGILSLAAGQAQGSVDVVVLGDTTDEADETFNLSLTASNTDVVVLRAEAVGTVLDDDGPVTLSVGDLNVTEVDADADALVPVTLSAVSGRTVRVDYLAVAASATENGDFLAAVGTLEIPAGSLSAEIPVTVVGDLIAEADESFTLQLSAPQNATLDDGEAIVTVFDNDTVELSVDDVSVVEGDDGSARAAFTVSTSLESNLEVAVDIATADGDAIAGADYTALAQTLTFAPGARTRSIEVPITGDLTVEPLETFLLQLSQPVNAVVADPEGIASILDDDGLLLSVSDLTVQEGADGDGVEAVFQLGVQKVGQDDVMVDFTTVDGTALAGADYQATSGTALLAAGSLATEVRVPLVGDLVDEPAESFSLALSNIVNGILLDAEGVATVVDDDGWHINGHAEDLTIPGCIVLTPRQSNRSGTAWRTEQVDLSQSFDKTVRVFSGSSASGGEGIMFAFQNAGPTARGSSSQGLGYSGISPSVALELDSNGGNTGDHMGINLNGSNGHNGLGVIPGFAFEDGNEHNLRMIWNANHQELDVHYRDEEIVIWQRDLVTDIFGGDATVWWGLTGGTSSGRQSLQYFCETEACYGTAADPKVSVGDVRRLEGDGGSQQLIFPVTLSCPSDQPVTVDFFTVDDTATAGSDYEATSGSLTFAPGEFSKSVTVTVFGDEDVEGDELFFVALDNAVGGTVRYGMGEGSIWTDDLEVVAETPTLVEGDFGSRQYRIPVRLNAAVSEPVTVSFTTRAGTATAAEDYVAASGSLTFPAGESAQTLVINVISDRAIEGDETVLVDFTGSGRLQSSTTTLTLFDDDDCGSPNLIENAGNDLPLVGGNIPFWTEVVGTQWRHGSGPFEGPYKFYARNVRDAELAQTVDVTHLAGLIDEGNLVMSFSGVVRSFNQNNPDRSQIVLEYRDGDDVPLEIFDSGQIANRTAWQGVSDLRTAPVGTRSVRVRLISERFSGTSNDGYYDSLILRAHPVPSLFSGEDVSIVEGQSQITGSATFEVRLNCDVGEPVRVDYLTRDDSATAGSDYEATFGTLVFEPGERLKTIDVPIFGDTLTEGDEGFSVELLSPVGALLEDPIMLATILDDESTVDLSDVTLTEGFEGTVTANVVATLSPASDQIVTVEFTTTDGTATAPEDYLSRADSVVFEPGETEKVLAIEVVGDVDVEDDEIFYVDLLEANNAGIGDGRAEITILQDDTTLAIGDVQILEGSAGQTAQAVFRVTLSSSSAATVTVDYETSDGSAEAGIDYTSTVGTLTFPPGDLEETISVPILGDDQVEFSETFFLTLSGVDGAVVGREEGTGYILDDDDCPSPSWLLNGGGDEELVRAEIPGWQMTQGTTWTRRTNTPAPFLGSGYFYPGSAVNAELTQVVDLSGYAARIDAATQRFLFEAQVFTALESPRDVAQIMVEYLADDGVTVLDRFDSGEVTTPGTWEPVADLRTPPPGTRSARVRLISQRRAGSGNNTYYDAISLRSLGTPVLLVDDATALESDGNSGLDITVRLTCAADTVVSADYTTTEETATEGVDYQPISGRFDIPPGDTEIVLTVPILGDEEIEDRETFRFDISDPEVAVIFDGQGQAVLVDDESEPAVDLRITKLAEPFAVRPGGTVDFTIQVQNRGFETATGVTLVDELPDHTLFVAASDGGSFDAVTRTVTWQIPSMDPRQILRRTLTLQGDPALPVGQTVINVVRVADDGSQGADQNPLDNRSEEPLVLGDSDTPLVQPRRAINLTATEGVIFLSSSDRNVTYTPSRAGDGNLSTSWFTANNGSHNQGGNPFWEATLPRDATVRELRMFGNRESASGFDIFSGIFRLYDAEDNLLFDSGEVDFPGANRDVTLSFDEVEKVRRLRFTPTSDQGIRSGFSELEMIGFFGDLGMGRLPEGKTEEIVAAFFDSEPGETHSATIDWGDGTIDVGVVEESGGNGTVTGSHLYADETIVEVEVCVTDSVGNTGCGAYTLEVENTAPEVDDEGDIDLTTWQTEHYNNIGTQGLSNWDVAEDGLSVLQRINSRPSIFYSDFPAFGTRITGRIAVETTADNDFIGFALGFQPGDATNSNADYLLFDWKQGDQGAGLAGLAVGRVTGIRPDVWGHATSEDYVELARGLQLGRIGWQDFTEYTFTFEFTPDRFRAFVDGVLELDVEGEFADGSFAFYNYSQQSVRYSAFGIGAVLVDEGDLAVVDAEFTDDGVFDTHIGEAFWSDGAVTPATISIDAEGLMRARAEHAFGDNGEYEAELCVTDNGGATGCGLFPIGVLNARPVVDTGPDVAIGLGAAFALPPATYVDPGFLDTHTATIDWGDGSPVEDVDAVGENGSGTVSGQHTYGAVGVYTVEVCVTDDDGDDGCDQVQVTVTVPPELQITKADVLAVDVNGDGLVNPGEEVDYLIVIDNISLGVATSVVLRDVIPAHAALVDGSVASSQGTVIGLDPVTVDIGTIDPGGQVTVTFRVRVDAPLPVGVDEIVNQAVISLAELPDRLSDDPDTAEADDPTVTPVVGDPDLVVSKVDSLVLDADNDSQVSPGDTLRYTLTVSNVGDGSASGVVLGDVIPTYTQVVPGTLTTDVGTVDGEDPVAVTLGLLGAGETATVTFDVTIDNPLPVGIDEVVNQASVDSDQLDTVLSDDPDVVGDADPTATPVVTTPSLDAVKMATLTTDLDNDGAVNPGDTLTYDVVVTSDGNTGATAVLFTDLIPDFTVLEAGSVEAREGANDPAGAHIGTVISEDPIEVDLGTMESSAAITVSFRVTVADPFPEGVDVVINQALIASSELEDVLSDDPATPEDDDPTVTPVVIPGQTTVCEAVPFGDLGDVTWTLSLLGDADQGDFQVVDERLHLSGDGTSLYHSLDNGAFYHHEVGSDADYRLEVSVTDFPVDEGGQVRKAALMLRTSTDPLAARVMVTFVPHLPGSNPGDPETTGLQFDARLSDGGNAVEIGNTVFGVPLSTRLAIEKKGDVATVYYSVDDGATWIQGIDATYGGSATIDWAASGETVLAGVMVASYDAQIPVTAEFANFEVCRPDIDPPVDPPNPPDCDAEQPLDVIVLMDVSGSMTASFPGTGSKLEAAKLAFDRLVTELASAPTGTRLGLITAGGFRTPEENLAGAYTILSPLTADFSAVNALAQGIDGSLIDPGVPTPTALALKGVIDGALPQFDDANQPIMLWLSDGIANIDILGRGPEPYELEEVQAISLRDSGGDFLSWGEVGWSGDFNESIGTFDGEPLANAMYQLERMQSREPDLMVYGVALQGDGIDLGTFNPGLMEYAAHVSGGRSFTADDTTSLVASIVASSNDAMCEVGTASLGGRLWQDRDGDGQQSLDTALEAGLTGTTVNLFDDMGFGITSTQTDGSGSYVFGQLPAGSYTVQVDASTLPSGDNGLPIDVATYDLDGIDTPETVDTATTSVSDGEVRGDVSFGYRERDPAPPAEICEIDNFEDASLDAAWQFVQIGDADQGSMAEADGTLQLTSDGTSLFHGTDNGSLVYRPETGDFRAQVRVSDIPVDEGGPVRKGCLMVRSGTGDLDARVMACYIPHLPNTTTQAIQFDVRREDGTAEEMADFVINAILPVEMAIVREGNVLRVEYSLDRGQTWIQPDGLLGGEVTVDLGASPVLGVMVASYDSAVTTTVAFDNFEVCRPNPDLP